MFRKISLPTVAVVLALSATGGLLRLQGFVALYWLFGAAAAIFLLAFLLKALRYPRDIWTDISGSSILASVSGAFFMALMQLAVYLKAFSPQAAMQLWYLTLIGYTLLFLWFTWHYILRNLNLQQFYPAYFLIYGGIALTSVTAPQFGADGIGRIVFWVALLSFCGALAGVLYRYSRPEPIPQPFQPFFCLFTAAPNLILAAYLAAFSYKPLSILLTAQLIVQLCYLLLLTQLPRLLRIPFYPSYAAFSFPFVITAYTLLQTLAYLEKIGIAYAPFFTWLAAAESLLAVLLVLYVTVCYTSFVIDRCLRCQHTKPND